jgi:hypothetical protein
MVKIESLNVEEAPRAAVSKTASPLRFVMLDYKKFVMTAWGYGDKLPSQTAPDAPVERSGDGTKDGTLK